MKTFLILFITASFFLSASSVHAVIKRAGSIELITNEPLFTGSTVWRPGLTKSNSFQVKNRSRRTKTVQIESSSEQETKELADILIFQVAKSGQTVYGQSPGKTLQDFFDAGTVNIGDVTTGDTGLVFNITISMPSSAGYQYQDASASFNLTVKFEDDSSSSVTVSSTSATSPATAPTEVPINQIISSTIQTVLGIGEANEPSAAAGGRVTTEQTTEQTTRRRPVALITLGTVAVVSFILWRRGRHLLK